MTMTEPELHHRALPRCPGRAIAWRTGSGAMRRQPMWWCVSMACRARAAISTCWRVSLCAQPTPMRVVCPDVVGRGRSDWLKGSDGLPDSGLCGRHAGTAGPAQAADAGLGRHQHGRPDRHGAVRAAGPAACRCRFGVWCSTMSGRASAGRRWSASAPTWARPAVRLGAAGSRRDVRRFRPVSDPIPRSSGWSCRAPWSAGGREQMALHAAL
jgi:hypothetical protein